MGIIFLLACSASIAFFLRQGCFDFVVGSLYRYLFITPLSPLNLKRGKLGGDKPRPYRWQFTRAELRQIQDRLQIY